MYVTAETIRRYLAAAITPPTLVRITATAQTSWRFRFTATAPRQYVDVCHRKDSPTVTSAHYEAAPTCLNNYSGIKFLAVARHSGCALPSGLNVCQRGNGRTVFRGRYCTPNTSLDNTTAPSF